ncbi:MAG: DEAD/DEAH box helicase [Clostridiales bacterium]|nr:DEAD/DEAH box helicase [Clostridiales bacterium]
MRSFNELPLDETSKTALIDHLNTRKIYRPSEIQAMAFDRIYEDSNIYAIAQTGSGKTISFLIPILCNLTDEKAVQAIIIAPTEELAIQIYNEGKAILSTRKTINNNLALLNGSGNLNRQINNLRSDKPSVVVGTPGRILQLIDMKKIKVHTVDFLVLDEADKLAEKSYVKDVEAIRKKCMRDIRIFFFSATSSERSRKLAQKLCQDILYLEKGSECKIPTTIAHKYVITERKLRTEQLRKILSKCKDEKWIIFAESAFACEDVYQKLEFHNYPVIRLYGKMSKQERTNAMISFRSDAKISVHNKGKILICTDVAARGIHVDNIYGVVNMVLPESCSEYQHRCGRCGRNGNHGECISIISKNELSKINTYEKQLNIKINELK